MSVKYIIDNKTKAKIKKMSNSELRTEYDYYRRLIPLFPSEYYDVILRELKLRKEVK